MAQDFGSRLWFIKMQNFYIKQQDRKQFLYYNNEKIKK